MASLVERYYRLKLMTRRLLTVDGTYSGDREDEMSDVSSNLLESLIRVRSKTCSNEESQHYLLRRCGKLNNCACSSARELDKVHEERNVTECEWCESSLTTFRSAGALVSGLPSVSIHIRLLWS